MSCPIDQEVLSAYVDHQLVPNEWEHIHAHLQTCSACREIVLELQSVNEDLANYFQTVAVSFAFENEVMQRVIAMRQTKHIHHLSVIFYIVVGIGFGGLIALWFSPWGLPIRVLFRFLLPLFQVLNMLSVFVSHGWFIALALYSIGFMIASFVGLQWLLRTLKSEVTI